jgi:hypothetical protein
MFQAFLNLKNTAKMSATADAPYAISMKASEQAVRREIRRPSGGEVRPTISKIN